MGFINKIKGILFDEEEIEVPIIKQENKEKTKQIKKEVIEPEKIEKKEIRDNIEENPIKEIKLPKEDFNDKVTYKSETTFTFPIDDFDDDFDDDLDSFKDTREIKTPIKEEKKRIEDKYERRDFSDFLNKKEEKKKFRPTPIISPVYGILDQNYKKEDVIVKKEVLRKDNDKKLDIVRKKVFGSLEDDIEANLEKEEEKPIDDIIVNENIIKDSIKKDNLDNNITEIKEKPTNTIDDLYNEVKEEKEIQEDINEEEEDLFSLIDSMYEEKEDE